MSDRPGIANRAMPLLSMMKRMAELWGYRVRNSDPCRNTRRYRMKPMQRILTAEETARLNAVLTRDEFWCPHIVAIVRLLMMTCCRFGEISALEWDWIKDRGHPHSQREVRAAHGLAVERRARGDRRHSAIQPRLSVSLSRPSADAAHRQHRLPMEPHPRRSGLARIAASRSQTFVGVHRRHERRGHGDHRQAARSCACRDDRTVCAPGARLDSDRRGTGHREHRREFVSR